ncbi:uncharacterized protein OCT59_027505 [Rhizophagus irregularis]|uniref:uncharacterized protein n=1 Tax=Rhizophagus irregularis TaxID=588596 RepID=UPI00333101A6|nr:hypothetical protein OCT59_027505 [Rhizophagus irregularis]
MVWLQQGPLFYNENEGWTRLSYKKVTLKFLYDSADEFINKAESYLDREVCYGISQNPDTKDYILIFSYDYLKCRCKKCGNSNSDIVFEWIPYDKFIDINEIGECGLTMAIWKDGPLSYDTQYNKGWMRRSYEKVTLKFSYDSENITDEFINKVESFLLAGQCYGISKTPGKFGLTTAIWKNGPLSYDAQHNKNWDSTYKKVSLRYLHNSQEVTDEFINKIKSYLTDTYYGISQNPDTKDYILVYSQNYINEYCKKCGNKYDTYYKWCKPCIINYLKDNFTNWTSGNEKIDNFIQEVQLKSDKYSKLFEWIPYVGFTDINEIRKGKYICITHEISLKH